MMVLFVNYGNAYGQSGVNFTCIPMEGNPYGGCDGLIPQRSTTNLVLKLEIDGWWERHEGENCISSEEWDFDNGGYNQYLLLDYYVEELTFNFDADVEVQEAGIYRDDDVNIFEGEVDSDDHSIVRFLGENDLYHGETDAYGEVHDDRIGITYTLDPSTPIPQRTFEINWSIKVVLWGLYPLLDESIACWGVPKEYTKSGSISLHIEKPDLGFGGCKGLGGAGDADTYEDAIPNVLYLEPGEATEFMIPATNRGGPVWNGAQAVRNQLQYEFIEDLVTRKNVRRNSQEATVQVAEELGYIPTGNAHSIVKIRSDKPGYAIVTSMRTDATQAVVEGLCEEENNYLSYWHGNSPRFLVAPPIIVWMEPSIQNNYPWPFKYPPNEKYPRLLTGVFGETRWNDQRDRGDEDVQPDRFHNGVDIDGPQNYPNVTNEDEANDPDDGLLTVSSGFVRDFNFPRYDDEPNNDDEVSWVVVGNFVYVHVRRPPILQHDYRHLNYFKLGSIWLNQSNNVYRGPLSNDHLHFSALDPEHRNQGDYRDYRINPVRNNGFEDPPGEYHGVTNQHAWIQMVQGGTQQFVELMVSDTSYERGGSFPENNMIIQQPGQYAVGFEITDPYTPWSIDRMGIYHITAIHLWKRDLNDAFTFWERRDIQFDKWRRTMNDSIGLVYPFYDDNDIGNPYPYLRYDISNSVNEQGIEVNTFNFIQEGYHVLEIIIEGTTPEDQRACYIPIIVKN